MNTTNIYIPQKIHVGYQEREDTYTGKLAYVIYTDGKGKKHKEASFNNWRDNKIPVDDYDNVATDGFVLNRKAGGVEESWGHYARLSYVRVYDPRGFEFEISIQNLLWILQECNSIKGKGLEGEFVYGWDGKDLVLVPTCSVEYKAICDNDTNKYIKTKDVVIGYTYEQKNGYKYVYLGRYDYYKISTEYNHDYYNEYKIIDQTTGIINYRYEVDGKYYWYAEILRSSIYITATKIPKKFYRCVEEVINPRYNEMINKMKHNEHYSPINYDDTEIIDLPFENFCMAFANNKNSGCLYVYSKLNTRILYLQIYIYNNNLSIRARDFTSRCYYKYCSDEDFCTCDSNGVNKFDLAKLYNKIKPICFIYKQINGNEYTRKGWYDKDGNEYVEQ